MSQLTPRILAELRELHAEVEAQGVGLLSSRRTRRARREARQAEADLLRGLGFASFEAVEATLAVESIGAAEELADPDERAALETEVQLRQVCEARRNESAPGTTDPGPGDARTDVEIDRLLARLGEVEEELAEARFEIKKLREDVAGLRAGPLALEELRAALQLVTPEIERFGEVLRTEREQMLDEAAREAAQVRELAAHDARALVESARAEAVALTRDALVTIDGLHRLSEIEAIASLPPVDPPETRT